MILLLVAFIAGMLTVLAPCVLPVLPVILGRTAIQRGKYTPYVVILSLSLSLLLFTLGVKTTQFFVEVPPVVWTLLGGGLLFLTGAYMLFPRLSLQNSTFERSATQTVGKGVRLHSYGGDMLAGAALGPVFASCSPTYFFILATILPLNFVWGSVAILSYTIGLALALLIVALTGNAILSKVRNHEAYQAFVTRVVGVLFVIVGLLIVTGFEKNIEIHLFEKSMFDSTRLEYYLLPLVP
jgi:cytochrome c-type biogenesis protein